eukprot:gnl/MRDRNA2_/MRDRNA2_342427_c0_seq1.p1 gnl/MRDRNA2_/MRDRNA2_342427_c0~~gnl/MRDRNA2_/MRDRNA2_342427_c0_seq1.p1  ORF type:complete len:140 (+),score=13.06 gnl/MRDRNA2_/MRDRNA2_342427_c0_seq1:175-594(+)
MKPETPYSTHPVKTETFTTYTKQGTSFSHTSLWKKNFYNFVSAEVCPLFRQHCQAQAPDVTTDAQAREGEQGADKEEPQVSKTVVATRIYLLIVTRLHTNKHCIPDATLSDINPVDETHRTSHRNVTDLHPNDIYKLRP